jgi:uncharacterized damage-inducible protein DinB
MNPQARFAWESLELRTPSMLRIVAALPEAAVRWWPPNNSNSIAWLLWHIAEVEDNWVRDKVYGLPKRHPFEASVREIPREKYPYKARLLAYFHEVRQLSRQRLEQTAQEDFDRVVHDEHFGTITTRQVWAGVVTSCAWHSGQIALTHRLIPQELKSA